MQILRRIAGEPLLHFAALGALLFALSKGSDFAPGEAQQRIVVTRGQVEQLATTFERTWQRPPSAEERDGLIEDWIRTEVAYREAQALGLDAGDEVVRRRLRQKIEFLTEDAGQGEPTEAQLRAYLEAHPDDFRTPARLSFRQIYLSPTGREDAAEDARLLLTRLVANPDADVSELGDPLLVPGEMMDVAQPEIASAFGGAFADALDAAPVDRWWGPVESGYGVHLVRVRARADGELPSLEQIRPEVEREWQNARRIQRARRRLPAGPVALRDRRGGARRRGRAAKMRLGLIAAAAACWGAVLAAPSNAHEVRPGYLEIREVAPTRFELFWKVPARGESERLGIRPAFPDGCSPGADTAGRIVGDAWIERGVLECASSLDGSSIRIDGLEATGTDVLVRVLRGDGSAQVVRLTPADRSFVVTRSPSTAGVALTYLKLGIEHILLGVDHLLFVLALLILVRGGRRLVATVTAFTVAHSLTLAAATLGLVHVSQMPVEAVIALSIVFVAAEIVHAQQGRPGLTQRSPWIVAFVFGLLHGLGFAGALAEVGLPSQAIPVALLFFNVGVEVGQLAFIAAVFAVWLPIRRLRVAWPAWSPRVPAYAIGAIAAYWTIERVSQL